MIYKNEDSGMFIVECETCSKMHKIPITDCKTDQSYNQTHKYHSLLWYTNNQIDCDCGGSSNSIVLFYTQDRIEKMKREEKFVNFFGAIVIFFVAVGITLLLKSCFSSQNSNNTYVRNYKYQDNNSLNTWNKSVGQTNGYDWSKMTNSQKCDIVQTVLDSWKSDFSIAEDVNWFIEGLNSFYGSPATNDTSLSKAMSIIGVAGNVLNKR